MPAPIEFNDLLRAKLAFWPTLKRAYALTFANFGSLIKLSWKWLLLLLPFQLLFFWHAFADLSALYGHIGQSDVTPLPAWVSFGAIIMGILAYVVFSAPAVGWHRLILRNEPVPNEMHVDAPMLRYAGYVLLLYGIYNVPVLVMQVFTPEAGHQPSGLQLLGIVASTAVLYVFIALLFRLCAFLPGVALDNPQANLATVWHKTRGHTFRLLFGNLLAALPFALFTMGTTYYAVTRLDPISGTIAIPVLSWVAYIGVAVGLTFTSLAYRFFYLDGGASPPS